jgi:hypothetical protein
MVSANSLPARHDPPVLLAVIALAAAVGGYFYLNPPTASFSEGIKGLGDAANANPVKMWILIVTTLTNFFVASSWLARTLGFKKQGSRLSLLTNNIGRSG